jgi:hypothetical protein
MHVKAPKIFSLIKNESETFKFIKTVKTCFDSGCVVLILLDSVSCIMNDAILLLLSTKVRFCAANIPLYATRPKNHYVRQKIKKSGFFNDNDVYGKVLDQRDQYTFDKRDSHLYTHGQKRVDAKLANSIVEYTSTFIWNEARRCQGVQKTLVELMHNTYDHADRLKGEKHWWLSVEQDEKNKEVTFAFIDFGVGIFRSLRNKTADDPLFGVLENLKVRFPWANSESELLKLILEGKIKRSQSNNYNRGKGLSKIYTLYKENKISSLVIISNFAAAHVDVDNFHELKDEFMGTFISFKINTKTISLPWTI